MIPSPNAPASTGTVTLQIPTAKKSQPPRTNSTTDPESLVCSMPGCGQTFEIKQHLQNHERTCSMKKYPCPYPGCDRRFKNSKQRHAHMTSRHKGIENSFRCNVPSCTAVFKTMERLKVHESRCRFKYEQFQLMELDENGSVNNNNTSFTAPSDQPAVPTLNTNSESTEPQSQPAESNAAFASLQQAASVITERVVVPASMPTMQVQNVVPIKLENGNPAHVVSNSTTQVQQVQIQHPNPPAEFQGFSTIDLSLVKSEIME